MQKYRHIPMKKFLVSRYPWKINQTLGFCLPRKEILDFFISFWIAYRQCSEEPWRYLQMWSEVLMSYMTSNTFAVFFFAEKDPGSNSKFLQIWPGGRWEDKTKKGSSGVGLLVFCLVLAFSPFISHPTPCPSVDGMYCWRQNSELKRTLVLLLDASQAVMTTVCQDPRLHH